MSEITREGRRGKETMIPQQQHPSSSETTSLGVHLHAAQARLRQAGEALTQQLAVFDENDTAVSPGTYQQALGTALAVFELAHELHVACQHLARSVSAASSAWDASGEYGHTQVVFVLAGARLRWVEVCANEAMSSLLAGLCACQSPLLIPLHQRRPDIRARLKRLAEACEEAVDRLARVADQVHQDARESTYEEYHHTAAREQEEESHP